MKVFVSGSDTPSTEPVRKSHLKLEMPVTGPAEFGEVAEHGKPIRIRCVVVVEIARGPLSSGSHIMREDELPSFIVQSVELMNGITRGMLARYAAVGGMSTLLMLLAVVVVALGYAEVCLRDVAVLTCSPDLALKLVKWVRVCMYE